MAQNVGKRFEENWKKSIPEDVMYFRIPDPPQSFEKTARFSNKPPFDCFVFANKTLFCMELKTTKSNGFSFERTKDDKGMIHHHQIENLRKYSVYDGVISGLVLNFRKESNDGKIENEITYFIHISDFDRMINELKKKSFTLIDLLKYNPIKIDSKKKRVNYSYDIKRFINKVTETN